MVILHIISGTVIVIALMASILEKNTSGTCGWLVALIWFMNAMIK